MADGFEDARVEFYAGYKGDETPRAVILKGQRLAVLNILSRQRMTDRASGRTSEVWRCRTSDGRVLRVERGDSGQTRVSSSA